MEDFTICDPTFSLVNANLKLELELEVEEQQSQQSRVRNITRLVVPHLTELFGIKTANQANLQHHLEMFPFYDQLKIGSKIFLVF